MQIREAIPNTTFINGKVTPAPMEAKMPAAYAKKSHFVAYWKTR